MSGIRLSDRRSERCLSEPLNFAVARRSYLHRCDKRFNKDGPRLVETATFQTNSAILGAKKIARNNCAPSSGKTGDRGDSKTRTTLKLLSYGREGASRFNLMPDSLSYSMVESFYEEKIRVPLT